MDIILLERIEKLGQMGDLVTVKNGYARNFLLPKKKALRATEANKVYFESKRSELEAANLQHRAAAELVAKKIDGLKLVLVRQAGESGQLYGSVTARDVSDSLKGEAIRMERGQVELNAAIKQLGQYIVPIKLHPEVSVDITVTVSRSNEQADIDAATALASNLMEKAADAEAAVQLKQEAEIALEQALDAEAKPAKTVEIDLKEESVIIEEAVEKEK